jgi:hypothetical protein
MITSIWKYVWIWGSGWLIACQRRNFRIFLLDGWLVYNCSCFWKSFEMFSFFFIKFLIILLFKSYPNTFQITFNYEFIIATLDKTWGKKIHKTRKMDQHGNFGLGLRKSCDPGVQGCPGAFPGVWFRTTLRPRPEPRVTPLDWVAESHIIVRHFW